ncbi:hypothetical protein [Gordonia sp. (in: high G+C Gram-positive bacteria)]|uniref:hypothetical protein n=1 Tax=Gordonia sp. (in: high G+C Gram-positive bacteria) TaxID=84139 RepID=UPI003F9E7F46
MRPPRAADDASTWPDDGTVTAASALEFAVAIRSGRLISRRAVEEHIAASTVVDFRSVPRSSAHRATTT